MTTRTEKLPRVRKLIAQRMRESLAGSAQLTSVVEADLTSIMDLRESVAVRWKAENGASLSPLAFVARATCLALGRHERLNATIDVEQGQVALHDHVNLGLAVDTPAGLMVPNIKGAQGLDVGAMAVAIADIAERTRGRKIGLEDIEGGTFTVTNTGSRGSLLDTPILNPPEVGILAVGSVVRRPVAVGPRGEESLVFRDVANLCLTYDHRLVDGADAARFLVDVASVLATHDFARELETVDA
jgi:2-oxoglutarate dehydrogenase E2 component (dihydrolipoamide succinyltransferase)